MPRRSRNETPAPEPASETPATQPATEAPAPADVPKPWTTESHGDGDVRIPAKLREQLKIGGHESFTIEVIESSDTGFALKFVRQAS